MSSWHDHVSEDTKIMIDKLCDLSEQQEKSDKKHTKFLLIFIGSLIILFIYAFAFILLNEASFLGSVANFLKNIFTIMLLLVSLVLFFIQLYFQSKAFSAWDQFESLRLETIDHLKCSWIRNEDTSIRDQISKEMDTLGINLRFKSIS